MAECMLTCVRAQVLFSALLKKRMVLDIVTHGIGCISEIIEVEIMLMVGSSSL
jgi:uridine phosphorylase